MRILPALVRLNYCKKSRKTWGQLWPSGDFVQASKAVPHSRLIFADFSMAGIFPLMVQSNNRLVDLHPRHFSIVLGISKNALKIMLLQVLIFLAR